MPQTRKPYRRFDGSSASGIFGGDGLRRPWLPRRLVSRSNSAVDPPMFEMSDSEFALFRDFVLEMTGILLRPEKRTLLENRLRPRLRAHAMTSYLEYYTHLRGLGPGAVGELANAVTTDTTECWRSPHQWDFLIGTVFPVLESQAAATTSTRALLLWSAGCSTGEEAYSLAIAAAESLPTPLARRVQVLATDVSPRAIERACQGRYRPARLAKLPPGTLERHFTPEPDGTWLAQPALRERVVFRIQNLLDPVPAQSPFTVIFCRNVMIYFAEAVRQRLVDRLCAALAPGGWLFLGPSEMLFDPPAGIEHRAPSVYRRSLP
ncbi:MAG: protein-glutamate O-methyltransferase CheR [Candidatus Wallbacteria bacterium]|nr:protein-glutamate O-methyltransferase CheR [Candidatus Wallbacteria bacterium]